MYIYICIYARLSSVFHIAGYNAVHFILSIALLHVGLNCLTILSSIIMKTLPIGHFQFLGYHSKIALIHLLSATLAMCVTQRNFWFWYSAITSFTLFHSQITLLRMGSHKCMYVYIFFKGLNGANLFHYIKFGFSFHIINHSYCFFLRFS